MAHGARKGALAVLAVKLLAVALAAAGGGTPLDLLARVPASVAAGATLPVCAGGSGSASLARRTVRKVLEPGMELLLFRLGDRGYASRATGSAR